MIPLLPNRTQSRPLTTGNGLLQGSIVGPLLFTLHIKKTEYFLINASFFADDTILYGPGSTTAKGLNRSQYAFDAFQLSILGKVNMIQPETFIDL